MKHRVLLFPAVLFLFAFSAISCIRAASPRGWAAPLENGSTLLISDSRGKLDAIFTSGDRAGSRQWRFPDDWDIGDKSAAKTSGIYGTPIIANNRLYISDYNGYVYALDLSAAPTRDASGKVAQKPKILWSRKPGGAIIGGLALDATSNTLFVTSDDSYLYGAKIGSDNPQFAPYLKTNDHIWSAPTVSNGIVYVSSTDGRLYAVDIKGQTPTAKVLLEASAALVTQPVVTDKAILVGGFDSMLHSVPLDSGSNGDDVEDPGFPVKGTNWIWSRPIVDSGNVYFADFDGNVYAVGLADGQAKWSKPFKASDSIRSAPVLAGDTLVVASHDGHIYDLDSATGASRGDAVDVGTHLNADLTRAIAPSLVYLAPDACVTPDQSKTKVYYYGLTLPANGGAPDKSTSGVC